MQYFAIVNNETGEIDDNCSKCSLVKTGDQFDIEDYPVPVNHYVIEIDYDEYMKVQDTGIEIEKHGKKEIKEDMIGLSNDERINAKPAYKYRLDVKRTAKRYKDRITGLKPIESKT